MIVRYRVTDSICNPILKTPTKEETYIIADIQSELKAMVGKLIYEVNYQSSARLRGP